MRLAAPSLERTVVAAEIKAGFANLEPAWLVGTEFVSPGQAGEGPVSTATNDA